MYALLWYVRDAGATATYRADLEADESGTLTCVAYHGGRCRKMLRKKRTSTKRSDA